MVSLDRIRVNSILFIFKQLCNFWYSAFWNKGKNFDLKPKLAGECWHNAPHFPTGGMYLKKSELNFWRRLKISARQSPPLTPPILVISSFSRAIARK